MDLIFSGFTTDRILINLQSKFFNASAPTPKIYVGGKLNIRYIAKELKPNETMQYNIYMCLAFLFDVNAYNSSAVFTKNYAALSILDDKLYGKYKVSATADFFTIENIGTSATVVSLVVLGR